MCIASIVKQPVGCKHTIIICWRRPTNFWLWRQSPPSPLRSQRLCWKRNETYWSGKGTGCNMHATWSLQSSYSHLQHVIRSFNVHRI